ncbi:MAG TPA: LamG domain-containing protein, partial [Solirubrobacteraceae bacterium]
MRRASLLAAVCALLAGPPAAGAAPPYADTVLAEAALAGYWAFNEPAGPSTADLRTTGAGLHELGARPGAAPLVRGGRSARYDGRHAATTVPNSRPLNPTAALSLEAWSRPEAIRHAATLAGKPGQYAIGFTKDGRAVLRLWARGRAHRLASAPGAVRAGRTTHLAGTFDGRAQRLYVDGRVRARRALDGPLDKAPEALVLGGGLRGRLDDVALYDAALDRATLAAHHAAGLGRRCPGVDLRVGLGAPWRPACWRPYLDGSAFDQPLRPGAPLAPDSAAVVARLAGRGPPQMIYGLPSSTSDPAWDPADFGHPLYTAGWADRASRVRCVRYPCPELRERTVAVPVGARPAQATDGHLAILEEATGEEDDLWQVGGRRRIVPALPGDGRPIRASAGGRTEPAEGLAYGLGSDATAAHFGLAAGIVRAPELLAGEIDHALFLLVDCADGFVPPAEGLGFACSEHAATPAIGTRLRLDYSDAEIERLDAPPWKKAVLRALARYGGYVGDTGAAENVAFEVS